MVVEFTGQLVLSVWIALASAVIVEVVKLFPPLKPYHDWIPAPLVIVCVGVGVLIAWLQGADMVSGGLQGLLGAALAIFGYEFVTHVLLRGVVERLRGGNGGA